MMMLFLFSLYLVSLVFVVYQDVQHYKRIGYAAVGDILDTAAWAMIPVINTLLMIYQIILLGFSTIVNDILTKTVWYKKK